MPELDVVLVFLVASLALNLTPGPDMLYVGAQSVCGGVRGGLAAALGITVGGFAHTLLAALGTSALLAAEPVLFDVVRYAGAIYLVWVAIQTFRSPAPVLGETLPEAAWTVFRRGVVTNILNPKVALFVLAFLPQFVDPSAGPVWPQILLLGTLFSLGGGAVLALVASGGGWIGRFMLRRPDLARWPNRIAGAVMLALAARLLVGGEARG